MPVTDEVRKRIASCSDIDQLEQWIGRAADTTEADELFG